MDIQFALKNASKYTENIRTAHTRPQPLFPRILPKFHVLKTGPFELHIPEKSTFAKLFSHFCQSFLDKAKTTIFSPNLSVFLTHSYVNLSVYLDCDGGKALRYLECISVQPKSPRRRSHHVPRIENCYFSTST
jgi:hypothetical protein